MRYILLILLLAAMNTHAGIIRIAITGKESPAFEGKTFGNTGAYEKLKGKAYGEIDPRLPQNALITDIQLAPRNARGMVEYAMDIYILQPLGKGNHKLFVELPNRGGKLYGGLNGSSGGNDPSTAAQAGEGWLLSMGYTILWAGWDICAAPVNNNMTITVPVAHQPDGSTITGPSYEYISFDNSGTSSYRLTYAAASLNKAGAMLTMRQHLEDSATVVNDWEYIDETHIHASFKQSAIYEFTYTAKDPLVAGLGLAATRDIVSYMRHEHFLRDKINYTFSFAISQPARFMNDFQTLGFNADEQGRQVFDGIENWVGGGSGVGINYRFAQTNRTERNRQDHLYPEGIFPFAYPVMKDPFSDVTAGRMHNHPKVFEINSANEYWCKAASLLHSDPEGHDLPDPPNVRFFLLSGLQHGGGGGNSKGNNQQLQNPVKAEPVLRALFIDLDEWVTKGIAPPDSRIPRHADSTAVDAIGDEHMLTGTVPATALGWPGIPGVTYTGLITIRHRFDYGPAFRKGVISRWPLDKTGPVYTCFVSAVDKDGNEIAGIRLPAVAVPTGTTTGWALRRAGYSENDGGEGSGQYIPFKKTKADRLQDGDPRLSLEERYPTPQDYINAVTKVVRQLQADRFLLSADAEKYIRDAINGVRG